MPFPLRVPSATHYTSCHVPSPSGKLSRQLPFWGTTVSPWLSVLSSSRFFLRRVLGGMACALVCTACAEPPAGVLATHDGGQVTVAGLESLLSKQPEARRRPPADQPIEAWVEGLLGDLAVREALQRRAQDSELSRDPAVLLSARFQASQEIGRNYVARQCPQEEIPEEELRQVYQQQLAREPLPWILLRHIYKRSAPAASPDERGEVLSTMEEIRAELAAGASFIELARQHSESTTAEDGGLIGRVSRQASMDKAVLETAWSLADGQFSGVIEVANGYHIVLREETGVEEARPFDQARETIRRKLQRQRITACGQEILQRLSTGTEVAILNEVLQGDPQPGDELIRVGEEAFTVEQLAGLTPERTPVKELPNPMPKLRRLIEARLLSAAAEAEDPTQGERFQQTEALALKRLLLAAQWRAQREALVASRPEAELRAYYESHRERFQTDPVLDLGLLLLVTENQAEPRALHERTLEVARRIEAGDSFEQLAEELSQHESREQGGRLGPLPWARLKVLLGTKAVGVAAELGTGKVSAPVQIRKPPETAYALLKLFSRQEPRPRSFEDVRPELVAILAREDLAALDDEVRSAILEEIRFRVHKRAFRAYLASLQA